jgi:hypothetical protein
MCIIYVIKFIYEEETSEMIMYGLGLHKIIQLNRGLYLNINYVFNLITTWDGFGTIYSSENTNEEEW